MARVMGVLNVTPDSFSDGGRFTATDEAVERGLQMARQGAAWIDVGGESSRPRAEPVEAMVERERVVPVIKGLRAAGCQAAVSIDTCKPAIALSAMNAGAVMWNDITALTYDPSGPDMAAMLECELVLMHMQGTPETMQDAPDYADVVGEVEAFLLARAEAAEAAGVARAKIWLDPGIGFGKTLEHNLALLNALPRLASHGYRLLLGASRKRTVQAIDPTAYSPLDRLGGSLALALHAAANGAAAVRVHDVRETVQALQVQAALAG